MVRIVLSEPDRDGVFIPQLAVTTGDETEALTFSLYGISHSVTAYANRLGSVGKLSNRIDISQAMGGVPQAVTFDFDLIDWDGFGRLSISLFEAAARFVGWEVSLIVDNADPINLAVKNCSTNGDTISFQCCSRYEITSRPCAFGAGGQQVGLVVGGHDVSVETAGLPEPVPMTRATPPYIAAGNPGNADNGIPADFDLYTSISAKATSKGASGKYRFACATGESIPFLNRIAIALSLRGVMVVGASNTTPLISVSADTIGASEFVEIAVVKGFWDAEDFGSVEIHDIGYKATSICAGASGLLGYIDGENWYTPIGESLIENYVLKYRPTKFQGGDFVAFREIPCVVGYDFTTISEPYGDTRTIQGDYSAPFASVDADLRPTSTPNGFYTWSAGGAESFRYKLVVDQSLLDDEDDLRVDSRARLLMKSAGVHTVSLKRPFTGAPSASYTTASGVVTFDFPENGAGSLDSLASFATFAALQAGIDYQIGIPTSTDVIATYQVVAANLYALRAFKFGSNSALVTPGAGPLDAPEGTFPARSTGGVTLPEAAACILSANGWFPQSPGNYPVGTVPTWTPSASAVGEYLEPSLSFIGAAEKLARESWAIFALEQNALGTSDELPEPPTITLGQDADIVTEPTIEYQPFGGKYLGKAYISNVDQTFDAANPDAFYGGWGLAPAGAEEAEGTDYGYLIWQRCRAAFLAHGIKRGFSSSSSSQFDAIHDSATMGRMWWEAKRNGFRRIDWLAFHPRYMTFSVKRFAGWGWAGSSTRLPQIMAGGAGYDVAAWGPLYNDAVTVVAVDADPMTGATTFSVALPPVVTDGHDIALAEDKLNALLPLDTDTINGALPLTTDTLEG